MKIKLSNVRLAFPSLFEAKTFKGEGKPAFSASFLIPKNDPLIATINAAIEQVAKDKWGAKAEANLKIMRTADKTALHNGDLKADFEGFEGNMYVSSRNPLRPLVLDANKTPLTEKDGKPYAGCFVNASIELWPQDNDFGKRINATLTGIQFARDGESFTGGGIASADDFDDVTSGASADDLV